MPNRRPSRPLEANWYVFKPGDIVLCQTGTEWGRFTRLYHWLVGDWGHAMMYVFDKDDMPYFIEARPKKGVSLIGGSQYHGKHIMVLRPKNDVGYGILAANEAKERAFDPDTIYGFTDIIVCVIKLIHKKLGEPVAPWKPNKWVICSELIAECYGTVGLNLDTGSGIPLPGDFVNCPQLEKIFEGELVIR